MDTMTGIVDIRWRVSARCGPSGTCVAVAPISPDLIGIRDTAGGTDVLRMRRNAWRSFITRVKTGEPTRPFDR